MSYAVAISRRDDPNPGPPRAPRMLRLRIIPEVAFEPQSTGDAPVGTRHPALAYLYPLAASSRRTFLQGLDAVAQALSGGRAVTETFPWHDLRYEHMVLLQARLKQDYGLRTANKHLSAVRGVLKQAWTLDLLTTDQYLRAISVKGVRGKRGPSGRALESDELTSLLALCAEDPRPAGRRDAALIMVAYDSGLRVFELVAVDVRDIDRQGRLTVAEGKGNKRDRLKLTERARELLEAWLAVRGREPGPLWVPINKGGRLARCTASDEQKARSGGKAGIRAGEYRRITERGVAKMLNRRREVLGLSPFSPHDLRRSMITHLLDRTGDVGVAQRRARHKNAATTLGYDRRTEARDAEIVEGALSVTFFQG